MLPSIATNDAANPRERSATERSIDARRARRERARRRDEHALAK